MDTTTLDTLRVVLMDVRSAMEDRWHDALDDAVTRECAAAGLAYVPAPLLKGVYAIRGASEGNDTALRQLLDSEGPFGRRNHTYLQQVIAPHGTGRHPLAGATSWSYQQRLTVRRNRHSDNVEPDTWPPMTPRLAHLIEDGEVCIRNGAVCINNCARGVCDPVSECPMCVGEGCPLGAEVQL